MPEYLSPGVYVEETSFRSKSIEGVSTTTTGFVGPCRYGPVDLPGELVTSLAEFERVYGDGADLAPAGTPRRNHLWHAARAFFAEGGRRLYVARAFHRAAGTPLPFPGPDANDATAAQTGGLYNDGYARKLVDGSPTTSKLVIRARHPDAYGNLRVRLRLQLGQNLLGGTSGAPKLLGPLADGDVVAVFVQHGLTAPTPDRTARYRVAVDPATGGVSFVPAGGPPIAVGALNPDVYELRPVTASVTVAPPGDPARSETFAALALDKAHAVGGQPDGLTARFGEDASNPTPTRQMPVVIRANNYASGGAEIADGVAIVDILTAGSDGAHLLAYLTSNGLTDGSDDTREFLLEGGGDGAALGATDYEGAVNPSNDRKTGLAQFEDVEDISIVAAPGATAGLGGHEDDALAVCSALIGHAERMRYRIAVLEPADGLSVADVRRFRARMDSKHAALYYPWVRVVDPATRQPIHLPPAGFVAGIYARSDGERGVYKAPANEVVNLAVGFETALGKGQQDALNPEGVNCFRFFEGRGYRLWGARTVSSDPEWKYVNLRRYFAYLERSIERGTQWAVFEPNGPQLWGNVRRTIESFLFNEFQAGALLGDRPDAAFFVKCDRTTMTQNDLDNGRLVCLIGAAVVRPAEFVIFRVGQWTGDRKAG